MAPFGFDSLVSSSWRWFMSFNRGNQWTVISCRRRFTREKDLFFSSSFNGWFTKWPLPSWFHFFFFMCALAQLMAIGDSARWKPISPRSIVFIWFLFSDLNQQEIDNAPSPFSFWFPILWSTSYKKRKWTAKNIGVVMNSVRSPLRKYTHFLSLSLCVGHTTAGRPGPKELSIFSINK